MNINIEALCEYSKDLTLLVVEDEREIRENIVEMCEDFFSHIYSCEDGAKAIESYKKHRQDIIFTDIRMPQMDGIELIKRVRAINELQQIVVVSAHSDTNYFLQLINSNVDGFILKPFSSEQFFAQVLRVCRNRHYFLEEMRLRDELKRELIKSKTLSRTLTKMNSELRRKNIAIQKVYENLEHRVEKEILEFLESNLRDFAPIDKETIKRSIEDGIVSSKAKKEMMENKITQKESLSAKEYLDGLNFEEYYREILDDIYDLDDIEREFIDVVSAKNSVDRELLAFISSHLFKYSTILKILVDFESLAYSLENLAFVLLDENLEIEDSLQKLFLRIIEALFEDLKLWRESIFIKRDAQDIHYLDASLFSNSEEIKNLIDGGKNGKDDEDEQEIILF